MCLLPFLAPLLLLTPVEPVSDPRAQAVLDRAIVYLGTQDSVAVYQGRYQFIEENKLAIEEVYGVHDSDFWTLDSARGDDRATEPLATAKVSVTVSADRRS